MQEASIEEKFFSIPDGGPVLNPVVVNRVTVVENVYYQSGNHQATNIHSQFCKTTEIEEQVYQRRYVITEDWKAIDVGWLKDQKIGYVILQNLEGDFSTVLPTIEQKIDAEMRRIEISYRGDQIVDSIIQSRESLRLSLVDVGRVQIRSSHKSTSVLVSVTPG